VSCLKLEAVTQANGTASVSFDAVSNQTYTVEWCADLGGGTWTKLTDRIARANNRTETVTDGTTSDAARFYRVITHAGPEQQAGDTFRPSTSDRNGRDKCCFRQPGARHNASMMTH
jgi:hypothetical protein